VTVRVYLPASLGALARFSEEGGIGPSPVHGHAVTAWLRASWPEGNDEELAYAALMAAADDSATFLATSTGHSEPPRRVVLVAEVERITEDPESTAVQVDSAISLRLLDAVHADTDDVDPSAPEALGDLAWFGVQEIPDLIG
jgi:hypothetical protein